MQFCQEINCSVYRFLSIHCKTYFHIYVLFILLRLGSFKSDPPVPRQRIERQKKTTGGEEKRAMPAQVCEVFSLLMICYGIVITSDLNLSVHVVLGFVVTNCVVLKDSDFIRH